MPITGAIPLPETGMDAFLKQLQLGQENRIQGGHLDLAKQQEMRQQQLMPYLIEDYKRKAQQARIQEQMMREFGFIGSEGNTNSSAGTAQQFNNLPSSDQRNIGNLQPGQSYVIGQGQQGQAPISKQQAIQRANQIK